MERASWFKILQANTNSHEYLRKSYKVTNPENYVPDLYERNYSIGWTISK